MTMQFTHRKRSPVVLITNLDRDIHILKYIQPVRVEMLLYNTY